MPDELTPQEKRELDAIDRALSGRAVDPELEDIAALTNELQELRATPSPEYASELDRRAAAWLGRAEPRRRRFPSLRLALPAGVAAAAAVVIALAVVGGDEDGDDSGLQLSSVSEERSAAVPAPQGEAAPEADSESFKGGRVVGKELELERGRVAEGRPFVLRYEVFRTTRAKVDLAGESGEITLQAGRGRLEVGTAGVPPGTHPLSVILTPGGSLHMRVEILVALD